MSPKSVLVTGANRGIGYGLVKKFLENKDIKYVFATARKPDEASELKELAADSRLHIIQMEVSCDKSIQAAVKEVEKVVGDEGLTILVNNAGILVKYSIKDAPNRAELAKQFDVNSISPVIVIQYFLPLLQKAAARNSADGLSTCRAAIINISSTGGSIASNDPDLIPDELKEAFAKMPPIMAYRASKSALNMFTKQLSHDLKGDGILVACFCPGWVQTDMGGPNAMIPLDACINELVPTIYSLKTVHTGGYFRQTGEAIPW